MGAVGSDENIPIGVRPICKNRGYTPFILLDVVENHPGSIATSRQRVLQRTIDASPRARDLMPVFLMQNAAVAVEPDERRHCDSHRCIQLYADMLHDRQQLQGHPDARAAACQFSNRPLEYDHVPAGPAQQVRRKQSTDRSADHHCAPGSRHRLTSQ